MPRATYSGSASWCGCHCDQHRENRGSPWFVPQAFTLLYLAGAFCRETCEVAIYCEFHSGPLRDLDRLAWPDLLTPAVQAHAGAIACADAAVLGTLYALP